MALRRRWWDREFRDDLRAGIVASTVANCNRDSEKKPEPFQPLDFMPNFRREAGPKEPLPAEQVYQAFHALARTEPGGALIFHFANRWKRATLDFAKFF